MPIKYNAYKHIVCLVLPSSLYVIMLFHILMLHYAMLLVVGC